MYFSNSNSTLSSWSSSLTSFSEQQYQMQYQENIPNKQQYIQEQNRTDNQINQQIISANNFKRPITGLHNQSHKNKPIPSFLTFGSNQFNGSNFVNQFNKYSRKVFIGGLPPDIDENEIVVHFSRYGQLIVDWPHKSETKSRFPPKGYAFLIFEKETSVQGLISYCSVEKDKYFIPISSPSIKDKPVQIRPWCLEDSDYLMENSQPVDPRKTIFVGGVPRPLKAYELAAIMNKLYGGVCYAGIDIDPELKYPKGAGRVSFSNHNSYVSAISARFVHLQQGDIDKRAEIKPYVLDDQVCDICKGIKCNGRYAQFFCANISCLQYYCESCWSSCHSKPGKDFHKPLVKEGTDRPRTIPFKWC